MDTLLQNKTLRLFSLIFFLSLLLMPTYSCRPLTGQQFIEQCSVITFSGLRLILHVIDSSILIPRQAEASASMLMAFLLARPLTVILRHTMNWTEEPHVLLSIDYLKHVSKFVGHTIKYSLLFVVVFIMLLLLGFRTWFYRYTSLQSLYEITLPFLSVMILFIIALALRNYEHFKTYQERLVAFGEIFVYSLSFSAFILWFLSKVISV